MQRYTYFDPLCLNSEDKEVDYRGTKRKNPGLKVYITLMVLVLCRKKEVCGVLNQGSISAIPFPVPGEKLRRLLVNEQGNSFDGYIARVEA